MRILLVEPDHATAQSIELMMKSEGFNIYTTDLGEEAVDLGKIYDYDLILLELNLPDIDGLEVLRQLRVGKINTPIMVLTRTSDIETKVKTFGGGADDFMTKPFHKDELVARCHCIVRRSKGHAQAIITIGNIALNLDTKTVEVQGHRVHLTGKEYMMLELLFLRKGSTLTKEMFLNHLYGGMDEPELKIVDVFICKLRKKLARANGGQHHIDTVWGRGYVVQCPSEGSGQNIAPATLGNDASEAASATDYQDAVTTDPEPVPAAETPIAAREKPSVKSLALAAITSGKCRFKDIWSEVRSHLPDVTEASVRSSLYQLMTTKLVTNIGRYKNANYVLFRGADAAAA